MKLFRFAFVLLLSLLAGLTLASSSISGTVTAAGTSPAVKVANVQVQLIGARRPRLTCATTYTDSSGRYSFTSLPAGKYRAVFSKDNFLPAYMSYYELANNVGVQLNASLVPYLQETEIERPRESQESFDIYNPNRFSVSYTWKSFRTKNTGSAVANPGHNNLVVPKPIPERVMLFVGGVHDQPCGYTLLAPPLVLSKVSGTVLTGGIALPGATVTMTDLSGDIDDTAMTDVNGAYTFFNTPNGVYTLTFTVDGYTTATKNIVVTGMPLVVPPITLSQLAQVNIVVTDAFTNPMPGASVSISYADGNSVQGTTDGNGFVSFANQSANVTATVSATANDGSGRFVTQTATFNPGPNSLTLTLPSLQPATLDVTVVDSLGNAVTSCTVNVQTSDHKFDSELTNSVGLAHLTGFVGGTTAHIFVFTADGTNRQGANDITLTPGVNTTSIALPATTANLSVHATDQFLQPQADAKVVIAYQDSTVVSLRTDANGNVTFTNLVANQQVTVTVTSADGTLGNSTTIYLQPGVNEIPLIELISVFANIGVTVSLGDGSSLDFAPISLVDAGGNVVASGSTGLTGSVLFTNMPANTPFTAQVTGPGNTVYTLPIDPVPAALTRYFSLQLPSADVTFTVSDANGPALDATILVFYPSDGSTVAATTDSNGIFEFAHMRASEEVFISVISVDDSETGNLILVNGFTPGVNNIPILIQ